MANLRTPLARVKGLGASGEGSHHWWVQRVTAIALAPLSLWFVFAMMSHVGDSHEVAIAWISHPGVAVLLVLYLGFMFFHAQLGLQVVIEDYVHNETIKLVFMLLMKGLCLLAGLASIFAVLRVAL
jgi:succinate dehydrogenase / fumarate reductase membrane anchor subunit